MRIGGCPAVIDQWCPGFDSSDCQVYFIFGSQATSRFYFAAMEKNQEWPGNQAIANYFVLHTGLGLMLYFHKHSNQKGSSNVITALWDSLNSFLVLHMYMHTSTQSPHKPNTKFTLQFRQSLHLHLNKLIQTVTHQVIPA